MKSGKQLQIFMIIIMVLILIGVISLFYYQKQRYSDVFFKYNGFDVHKVNNAGIDEYKIQFFLKDNPQPFIISSRYNPKDLEDIGVYEGLRKDLIGGENLTKKELYITLEPTLGGQAVIAFSEINRYIENPFLFNLPTKPGLIRAVEGNDLPVITCENVSEEIGVISFEVGNKNQIYSKEGCVILEAMDEGNLIRVADRLTLTSLEIMKP